MSSGMMDLSISAESLERANSLLKNINGGFERAIGSALKRAADSGKTVAKGAVSKDYAISQSQFLAYTQNVNSTKTGTGSVSITFGYRGTVIPLLEFHTSISKEGGVRANVKRANAPKRISRAFQMKSGSLMRREGSSRYPIHKLYGPATPQMIYSDKTVQDAVEKKINDTWEDRIDHEISRILSGYGA